MSKKFREYLNEMISKSTIDFYTNDKEVLREAIMYELDASNVYYQMAQKVRSQEVKRVLEEVAKEEKEHFGKFEALLEKLDPEHEEMEEEGEEELKDMGINVED